MSSCGSHSPSRCWVLLPPRRTRTSRASGCSLSTREESPTTGSWRSLKQKGSGRSSSTAGRFNLLNLDGNRIAFERAQRTPTLRLDGWRRPAPRDRTFGRAFGRADERIDDRRWRADGDLVRGAVGRTRLRSWLNVVLRFALALPLLGAVASAQNADFAGKWVLALDTGRVTDYGILEIAETEGEWQIVIDGGSVNLLNLDGNRIAFDFDWTDGADRLHVTELSGEHLGERMSGSMTEGGEPTGTWSAEPWVEHPDTGADPAPVNLSGVWRSLARGTHKDDLTPAGAQSMMRMTRPWMIHTCDACREARSGWRTGPSTTR